MSAGTENRETVQMRITVTEEIQKYFEFEQNTRSVMST